MRYYNIVLALVCLAAAAFYGFVEDGSNRNAMLVIFAIFLIQHRIDLAVEKIESRLRVMEHMLTIRRGA